MFEKVFNEIIEELNNEEQQEKLKKAEIIKNGCPHTNKIEKTSLVYKTKWLECTVCGKQYYLDGREVE